MLEKNKDYIELKAACCSADYCQGYMTHLDITGYSNSDLATPLPNPGTDYILISKDKFEALQTENEQLKKKLHEFDPVLERFLKYTCGGQVSVNGWEESAKFWKKRYDDIFKLIGFSSKEEVEDYLVNEAECDTLHEAILKLINENKYACEEWCKANSSNNSWKAAAECNSPKGLIEKIKAFENEIGIYSRTLQEWKEGTGCPSPSTAKTLIESGESWYHAYNEIKKANEKLVDDVKSWRNVTGYSTPEGFLSAMLNDPDNVDTVLWRDATGFYSPSEANIGIRDYENTIKKWKEITGCSTLEEAQRWVAEIGEANGNLAQAVLSWQNVTGFKTPKEAKDYWTAKLSESGESNESLAREVRSWHEITGFSTPEKCSSYIDTLEEKLEEIKNLIEED